MIKWERPMLISLNGTKGAQGTPAPIDNCGSGSGASGACKTGNMAGACTTGGGGLSNSD